MKVERPTPARDEYEANEVREGSRALLRRPMLRADDDRDAFRLVRKHRERLARLFAESLGYRLVVDARTARLYKAGLGPDPTRGLRRRNGAPFTPRTYAMMCLVLAALTRTKGQLLMDELVGEIRSAAADAGIDVDLERVAERRALQAALLLLLSYGVLRERDSDGGGLERWAEDATARSLLDVDRERLGMLVSAPLTSVTSIADLLQIASVPSGAGGARVAIRRTLVESPVMSSGDLPPDQLDWWGKNRNRERERLAELFGLELELRVEGALVIDPREEVSDIDFPGPGTMKRFALLILDDCARRCRATAPTAGAWAELPASGVAAAFDEVVTKWGKALTKAYRADPETLADDILALLTDVGLVRVRADGAWAVHAAAARYSPQASLETGTQPSLFDDDLEETAP